MRLVALVFAVLAALMHLYIFWMESLRWERPETRKVFGTSPEQAADHSPARLQPGLQPASCPDRRGGRGAVLVAGGVEHAADRRPRLNGAGRPGADHQRPPHGPSGAGAGHVSGAGAGVSRSLGAELTLRPPPLSSTPTLATVNMCSAAPLRSVACAASPSPRCRTTTCPPARSPSSATARTPPFGTTPRRPLSAARAPSAAARA